MIFLSRVISMLKNTIHQNTDYKYDVRSRVMVINATFNNISVTLWRSVFMGGGTGGTRDHHRPVASH